MSNFKSRQKHIFYIWVNEKQFLSRGNFSFRAAAPNVMFPRRTEIYLDLKNSIKNAGLFSR